MDSASVVQDPQQSVIRTGLDQDQLDSYRLEPHTGDTQVSVFACVLCVLSLRWGGVHMAHLCRWFYEDPCWQHHVRVQRLGPDPEVD